MFKTSMRQEAHMDVITMDTRVGGIREPQPKGDFDLDVARFGVTGGDQTSKDGPASPYLINPPEHLEHLVPKVVIGGDLEAVVGNRRLPVGTSMMSDGSTITIDLTRRDPILPDRYDETPSRPYPNA
jgi:hypothetical protein